MSKVYHLNRRSMRAFLQRLDKFVGGYVIEDYRGSSHVFRGRIERIERPGKETWVKIHCSRVEQSPRRQECWRLAWRTGNSRAKGSRLPSCFDGAFREHIGFPMPVQDVKGTVYWDEVVLGGVRLLAPDHPEAQRLRAAAEERQKERK